MRNINYELETSEKLVGQSLLPVKNIKFRSKTTDRNVCPTKHLSF